MDAVLRVDHEARIGLRRRVGIDHFVDTSGAIKARWLAIARQVDRDRHRRIEQFQMRRLVFLVVGRGHEHRRELVERDHPIGLRVDDRLDLIERLQRLVIGLAMLHRAERREAGQFVEPHVDTAEHHPADGAELRPERLDVAHRLQVTPDGGRTPRLLIASDLIMGAASCQCIADMLRGEHARDHGVVAALDARHVDEACRTAKQRAAWEGQARHRLPAALGDRTRSIGQPLAALEHVAHHLMGLESLELVEGRERGILVVQMHHEANRH